MSVPAQLIAWAAGLYDGEGSASSYVPQQRKTARRQMQLSQGGGGVHPDVLVRFRQIVGEGNINGPYRGYLYYWKTTRKDAVDEIAHTLWPYLSREKRLQLQATAEVTGRSYLDLRTVRHRDTEAAWAAGLFDGEGSLWLTKDARLRPDRRGIAMELAQASSGDVPEALHRFHDIVGVGHISGPRSLRNPWTKLPQYRWQVSGRHKVSSAIRVMWPWLSAVKRSQIRAVSAHLDPDLDLSAPFGPITSTGSVSQDRVI